MKIDSFDEDTPNGRRLSFENWLKSDFPEIFPDFHEDTLNGTEHYSGKMSVFT